MHRLSLEKIGDVFFDKKLSLSFLAKELNASSFEIDRVHLRTAHSRVSASWQQSAPATKSKKFPYYFQ